MVWSVIECPNKKGTTHFKLDDSGKVYIQSHFNKSTTRETASILRLLRVEELSPSGKGMMGRVVNK